MANETEEGEGDGKEWRRARASGGRGNAGRRGTNAAAGSCLDRHTEAISVDEWKNASTDGDVSSHECSLLWLNKKSSRRRARDSREGRMLTLRRRASFARAAPSRRGRCSR